MAPDDKVTPTKAKSTPTKEKSISSKEKGTPSKEKPFAGLSSTETKLLVVASRFIENGKVDYDELALRAGVMASSARTLFRGARRKVDQFCAEATGEPQSNENRSADGTPVAKRKASTKANPRSPKTPRKPKATKPKAAAAPRAVDNDETDLAESDDEGSNLMKENLDQEFGFKPLPGEPNHSDGDTPGL